MLEVERCLRSVYCEFYYTQSLYQSASALKFAFAPSICQKWHNSLLQVQASYEEYSRTLDQGLLVNLAEVTKLLPTLADLAIVIEANFREYHPLLNEFLALKQVKQELLTKIDTPLGLPSAERLNWEKSLADLTKRVKADYLNQTRFSYYWFNQLELWPKQNSYPHGLMRSALAHYWLNTNRWPTYLKIAETSLKVPPAWLNLATIQRQLVRQIQGAESRAIAARLYFLPLIYLNNLVLQTIYVQWAVLCFTYLEEEWRTSRYAILREPLEPEVQKFFLSLTACLIMVLDYRFFGIIAVYMVCLQSFSETIVYGNNLWLNLTIKFSDKMLSKMLPWVRYGINALLQLMLLQHYGYSNAMIMTQIMVGLAVQLALTIPRQKSSRGLTSFLLLIVAQQLLYRFISCSLYYFTTPLPTSAELLHNEALCFKHISACKEAALAKLSPFNAKIATDFTAAQIRQAWRMGTLFSHPDHGGNTMEFDELTRARNTLEKLLP
jgi:hypothetical protein